MLLLAGSVSAAAKQVTSKSVLEVSFKLVDQDDRPVPSAQVRLVLDAQSDWQASNAGQVFVTDSLGQVRFSSVNVVKGGSHKRPTNFVDSLFSRAEPVDSVQVAAGLEYAGRSRLIVIRLHRFRSDVAMLLDGFEVYTPDTRGRFTRQGHKVDGYSWKIPEPDGLQSGHPGFEVVEFNLEPMLLGSEVDAKSAGDNKIASDTQRWLLKLVLRRLAPPVQR
ncbi:MAG: hypothetical protein QM808_12355 [Steroidobacteraceae bacterium]